LYAYIKTNMASKRPRLATDNEVDDLRASDESATRTAQIRNLNGEDALRALQDLADRWQLDYPSVSYEGVATTAFENFDCPITSSLLYQDLGSFGLRQLDLRIRGHEQEAVALYHRLRELDLLQHEDNLRRIVQCLEMIYYGKRLVLTTFQAKLALHAAHSDVLKLDQDLDERLKAWVLRFRWLDNDVSLNAMQQLLLHLLDVAMARNLRKQNGVLFEPIMLDGAYTHSFRMVSDVKDFVYSEARKEVELTAWLNLTSSNSNSRAVIEYMTACKDYQLPDLIKCRTAWSFRNGVYLGHEDRFLSYTDMRTTPLPFSLVCAKFFEADFPTEASYAGEDEWRNIPTPYLESIMTYQKFEPCVIDWLYILLGRCLYNVGTHDGWQVLPFFKGIAGSGKSTICTKVIQALYDPIDVGTLSNNIEKKFGISAFFNKFVFIGPEVKADLQIEQSEFQCMISGEAIQVNVKNKTAFSTQWLSPGVLAGNEIPGFADNAGSIQRRLVVFDFTRGVVNGDMRLGDRITEELPALLLKINRAYREASGKWHSTNIWRVLPAYFQGTQADLAQQTSSIEAFLASGEVVMAGNLYVPFDEFKQALRTFESSNSYTRRQYTMDFFRGAFSKHMIEKVKDVREYPMGSGRTLKREWLTGVDLASSAVGGEDADAVL
jgi:hypothetical protein